MKTAYLTAGIPSDNMTLYRKMRFMVGDPAAVLEFDEPIAFAEARPSTNAQNGATPGKTRLLILRDIENERAIANAHADLIACPANFAPTSGLSGDREVATAQSVAEAFRRAGVAKVVSDRSLPLIYAHELKLAGIECECDIERGVLDRRSKDAGELALIREAQAATEDVMRKACVRVGTAKPDAEGRLIATDGVMLTSENMRAFIDHTLLDAGYSNVPSIVAGQKYGGDCHNYGTGPLYTGEPIIIDIFPTNKSTRYCGDCTRTVVNGEVQPIHQKMFEAVKAAKAAATAAIKAGVTGEDVHRATIKAFEEHGFGYAAPGSVEAETEIRLTHGTGHGLGLSVHEPPLEDFKGPALVVGDVMSVEPGLYSKKYGGIRIEDIVVVTEDGCINLGSPLPEKLDWLE